MCAARRQRIAPCCRIRGPPTPVDAILVEQYTTPLPDLAGVSSDTISAQEGTRIRAPPTSRPPCVAAATAQLIPIRGFVHEVLRHSRTSTGVLEMAQCYLKAVRVKVLRDLSPYT